VGSDIRDFVMWDQQTILFTDSASLDPEEKPSGAVLGVT